MPGITDAERAAVLEAARIMSAHGCDTVIAGVVTNPLWRVQVAGRQADGLIVASQARRHPGRCGRAGGADRVGGIETLGSFAPSTPHGLSRAENIPLFETC